MSAGIGSAICGCVGFRAGCWVTFPNKAATEGRRSPARLFVRRYKQMIVTVIKQNNHGINSTIDDAKDSLGTLL